jgi:membrane-bound serine protease (ClpP class)
MTPSFLAVRFRPSAGALLVVAALAWMAAIVAGCSQVTGPPASPAPATPEAPAGDAAPVIVLTATGIVDNVMAGYIEEGIRQAVDAASPAVVVTLNTPGGSLDSTQRIVSALLEARVPAIVWVAPSGARAASAGTFITLAAALAYMAPGTNIGAASPVGAGGEELEGTIGDKVRNDAIANIRSIAEARGRDVAWAVSTVERAVSSSAVEAVEIGAVDAIAVSIDDVLRQADGQVVDVPGGAVTVDVTDAPVVDLPMNPFQATIHLLSDPNIAFILLTLGFYGLIFELQSPNFVTGVLGAIALVLAFIGFGSLPLNVAGLLLIGLAILFFVLESTVTSHGLLTAAGLVCFVLGAFTLYTAPGTPAAPDVTVAAPLVIVMAVATAAFMGLALATVVRVRQRSLRFAGAYGAGGTSTVPTGSGGVVKATLAPLGVVYAAGEDWSAKTIGGTEVGAGESVRVIGQEGLTLIVEPVGPGDAATEEASP